MLVCVWGHSAVGKSHWLESIMDELPSIQSNLVVVMCDYPREYYYRPNTDDWYLVTNGIREKWKGTKAEKINPAQFIHDKTTWVVESSRYFNGLQAQMVEAFRENGCQGLHVIIPWAQSETHSEFIRQRCLLKNKPMSQWWQNLDNCQHEANNRLNSIPKWFQPNGVPATSFEIDLDRKNWNLVTQHLKDVLRNGC